MGALDRSGAVVNVASVEPVACVVLAQPLDQVRILVEGALGAVVNALPVGVGNIVSIAGIRRRWWRDGVVQRRYLFLRSSPPGCVLRPRRRQGVLQVASGQHPVQALAGSMTGQVRRVGSPGFRQ